MKKQELQNLIREEVRKTLNEVQSHATGTLAKYIKPKPQGEIKVAVDALEERLINTLTTAGFTRNAKEFGKDISKLIKAVKQDETGAEDDPF